MRPAAPPPRIHSFEPLGAPGVAWLVLGTMPGRTSLAAGQYYAHPRNAFWPIMESLFGIVRQAPYPERMHALAAEGVALWDVLACCTRATSLDADIDPATCEPNDIAQFLGRHGTIHAIGFNGMPACKLFERMVLPSLSPAQCDVPRITLPSTSPANARLSFEEKLRAWSVLTRAQVPRC